MLIKLIEVDLVSPSAKPGVYFEKTSGDVKVITGDESSNTTMYLYLANREIFLDAKVDIEMQLKEARLEGKLEAMKELIESAIVNVDVSNKPEEQLGMSNILKLIAVAQKPELAFDGKKK